jgi:hypothetical protein
LAERQLGSRFRPNEDAGDAAPPWVRHFLAGLIVTGSLRQALDEAGIEFEMAWALRRAEPEFAYYWDRAAQAHRRIAAGVPFAEAVSDDTASVH